MIKLSVLCEISFINILQFFLIEQMRTPILVGVAVKPQIDISERHVRQDYGRGERRLQADYGEVIISKVIVFAETRCTCQNIMISPCHIFED